MYFKNMCDISVKMVKKRKGTVNHVMVPGVIMYNVHHVTMYIHTVTVNDHDDCILFMTH